MDQIYSVYLPFLPELFLTVTDHLRWRPSFHIFKKHDHEKQQKFYHISHNILNRFNPVKKAPMEVYCNGLVKERPG